VRAHPPSIATDDGAQPASASKAPLTFARRTLAGSAACSSVARRRNARRSSTGRFRIPPAKRAIS
jgi:hypothetical protein